MLLCKIKRNGFDLGDDLIEDDKMKLFLFVFILILQSHTLLSKTVKRSAPWRFKNSFQFWIRGTETKINESQFTHFDSPFALPLQSYGLLIQDTFVIKKQNWELNFRPSVGIYSEEFSQFPKIEKIKKKKSDIRVNELYFYNESSAELLYAIGLQNFQWGPAELLSPSNPLFHFIPDTQDPSYQARGHSLVRINYTPSNNFSFIFLYEFAPNEEKPFIYEAPFVPMGLIKSEFRLPNPTDYIGLTFGNEQMHDTFVGEYGNFTFEGLSFYFDIKQTKVSKRYYPQMEFGQPPNMVLYDFADSVYVLSLGGIRYEGDYIDLRWEEVSNELGFKNDEFELATVTFVNPNESNALKNKKAFLNSGRELPSKNYTFVSFRSKGLSLWLDSVFTLRGLYSRRDKSSLATLQWEGSVGDYLSFFLNHQANFGKKGSETNFLYQNKSNFGIKFVW